MKTGKIIFTAVHYVASMFVLLAGLALLIGTPTEWWVAQFGLFFSKVGGMIVGAVLLRGWYRFNGWITSKGYVYGIIG